MLRQFAPLCLPLWLMACTAGIAGAPVQSPRAPAAASPTSSAPPEANKKPSGGLGEAPRGLAAADKACADYAGAPPASCATGELTELLATALSASGAERDLQLRCLEQAPGAPAGLLRALRADLSPRGCADAVVGSEASFPGAAREVADTLVALGVGARLYRSVRQPPLPRPPFDKPAFLKHFKGGA